MLWSHDYPTGEQHFMKILNELTTSAPHIEETNILSFDDPELFKYPVAYICEPGPFFSLTDEEAANFRAYLLKGGFVIVDDFARGAAAGTYFEDADAPGSSPTPGSSTSTRRTRSSTRSSRSTI